MASELRLDWEVDLAGIDYATQAIIGLTLAASEPLPERVWVWAYYVNSNFGPESSWSDEPKEVVIKNRENSHPATLIRCKPWLPSLGSRCSRYHGTLA